MSLFRIITTFAALLLLGVPVHASHLAGNIALGEFGATAHDNGYFDDYGIPRNAACTIDDDPASYWAGRVDSWPQQVWIHFDREYEIAELWIDELDHAFMTDAEFEILRGGEWVLLFKCFKTVPDLHADIPVQDAEGLRITIYAVDTPSSWYNPVACLRSVEAAIRDETSTQARTISAIRSLY